MDSRVKRGAQGKGRSVRPTNNLSVWSTLEIKQPDISPSRCVIVKKALEELEDKDSFSSLHMDSK